MTVPTRARVLSTVAALFASCLALALPLSPARAAEGTIHYTKESLHDYEAQLAGGQIVAATFNKRIRSLHLTLKNGQHVLVHYAPHEREKLEAALRAKGIPVSIEQTTEAVKEAKSKPVHHKLRYIVGGIAIAVVIIVGAVLLIDRRRKATAE
jgi:hypothetical protein